MFVWMFILPNLRIQCFQANSCLFLLQASADLAYERNCLGAMFLNDSLSLIIPLFVVYMLSLFTLCYQFHLLVGSIKEYTFILCCSSNITFKKKSLSLVLDVLDGAVKFLGSFSFTEL